MQVFHLSSHVIESIVCIIKANKSKINQFISVRIKFKIDEVINNCYRFIDKVSGSIGGIKSDQ